MKTLKRNQYEGEDERQTQCSWENPAQHPFWFQLTTQQNTDQTPSLIYTGIFNWLKACNIWYPSSYMYMTLYIIYRVRHTITILFLFWKICSRQPRPTPNSMSWCNVKGIWSVVMAYGNVTGYLQSCKYIVWLNLLIYLLMHIHKKDSFF